MIPYASYPTSSDWDSLSQDVGVAVQEAAALQDGAAAVERGLRRGAQRAGGEGQEERLFRGCEAVTALAASL